MCVKKRVVIAYFERELLAAKFISRPNRFVIEAKIEKSEISRSKSSEHSESEAFSPERGEKSIGKFSPLDSLVSGSIVSAHLPDPGRLKGILQPGVELILSPAKIGKERKTKFDAIAVFEPKSKVWVSLDSNLPNRLFPKMVELHTVSVLRGKQLVKREVRLPEYHSRFDFLLRDLSDSSLTLVEIKSVTMVREGRGYFPDAPSVRAVRHLTELAKARQRFHPLLFFVAQRPDVDSIAPALEIDPLFARTLEKFRYDVELSAVSIELRPEISRGRLIVLLKDELPVIV